MCLYDVSNLYVLEGDKKIYEVIRVTRNEQNVINIDRYWYNIIDL